MPRIRSALTLLGGSLAIGLGVSSCDARTDARPAAAEAASPDHAAGPRLEPGLWTQSGRAGSTPEPRCITAAEAVSANGNDAEIRAALDAQARTDNCSIASVTINGPVIAFEQVCGGTKVHVSTTYRGSSSSTQMSGDGIPSIQSEGRRVGDCRPR